MVKAVFPVMNIVVPIRKRIRESRANGLFVSLCTAKRAKTEGQSGEVQ